MNKCIICRYRSSCSTQCDTNQCSSFEKTPRKRVYLSGPITGTEDYLERFKRCKKYLDDDNNEVVSPIENGLDENAPYHEHMRRDVYLLTTCDAIYMMKGWESSHGCVSENYIAKLIGLEILEQ